MEALYYWTYSLLKIIKRTKHDLFFDAIFPFGFSICIYEISFLRLLVDHFNIFWGELDKILGLVFALVTLVLVYFLFYRRKEKIVAKINRYSAEGLILSKVLFACYVLGTFYLLLFYILQVEW